jgi:hypothetical protein
VFCRDAGFEHVSRYVTGLILSPHKTLQGTYDLQVWSRDCPPSRRTMHEAVFEAGWAAEALMPRHRALVAPAHCGRGHEVLCLDWTFAHHERGPHIWGVTKGWDDVEQRLARYQTVVTAVVANRGRIDGVEVVVQVPNLSPHLSARCLAVLCMCARRARAAAPMKISGIVLALFP